MSTDSKEQTGISLHLYQMQKQMTEHSCCCVLVTYSNTHWCLVSSAWNTQWVARQAILGRGHHYHFGLEEERTMGVRPRRNRFLVLLKLTTLKIILWSTWTLSTEKLNQNLWIKRTQGRYENMMPVPVSRVASVRADKEVILRFIDEVNSAKVSFINSGN